MGRPNVAILNADTVLTPFYSQGIADYLVRPLFLGALIVATVQAGAPGSGVMKIS